MLMLLPYRDGVQCSDLRLFVFHRAFYPVHGNQCLAERHCKRGGNPAPAGDIRYGRYLVLTSDLRGDRASRCSCFDKAI